MALELSTPDDVPELLQQMLYSYKYPPKAPLLLGAIVVIPAGSDVKYSLFGLLPQISHDNVIDVFNLRRSQSSIEQDMPLHLTRPSDLLQTDHESASYCE